jgi:hypothetical protein
MGRACTAVVFGLSVVAIYLGAVSVSLWSQVTVDYVEDLRAQWILECTQRWASCVPNATVAACAAWASSLPVVRQRQNATAFCHAVCPCANADDKWTCWSGCRALLDAPTEASVRDETSPAFILGVFFCALGSLCTLCAWFGAFDEPQ